MGDKMQPEPELGRIDLWRRFAMLSGAAYCLARWTWFDGSREYLLTGLLFLLAIAFVTVEKLEKHRAYQRLLLEDIVQAVALLGSQGREDAQSLDKIEKALRLKGYEL